MSIVTLCLGQCGNQVGVQVFDTLSQQVQKAPQKIQDVVYDTFFRPPPNGNL